MSGFDRFPKPLSAEALGWTSLSTAPATGAVRIAFDAHRGFRNPGGNI